MVDLIEIKEGKARILVPKTEWKKGPNSAKVPVFYNPTMEMNRDVSVALLKAVRRKEMKVLDGLAASGIRGIRFALEIGEMEITLNDRNKKALKLMEKNADLNRVDVKITGKNLNTLLSDSSFDYIDIDPFGSPAEFLDCASRAIRNGGILAITATDTAALCGVYPKVCYRRYMAWPEHNWCMHEIGLRILIGSAVRIGGRNDISLKPLLAYSTDHYFRAYLMAEKGARKADAVLENVGMLEFDDISWKNGGDIGPMWLGALFDEMVLSRMKTEDFFGSKRRMEKFMDIWKEEWKMPPCYHELSYLSSFLHISQPPIRHVIERLKSMGFEATRTHCSPTGIKTDASAEEVLETMRE